MPSGKLLKIHSEKRENKSNEVSHEKTARDSSAYHFRQSSCFFSRSGFDSSNERYSDTSARMAHNINCRIRAAYFMLDILTDPLQAQTRHFRGQIYFIRRAALRLLMHNIGFRGHEPAEQPLLRYGRNGVFALTDLGRLFRTVLYDPYGNFGKAGG